MSKKYFEIEMITTATIEAENKNDAIKKWHHEYVDLGEYDHPEFHFDMTGNIWEVPFIDEGRWVKLLPQNRKKI